MSSSEYKSSFLDDKSEIALVKLSSSVLGGNDALSFTSILDELTSSAAKCIIIDACDVQIMNSTGIGMLANAHSNLSKNGLRMMLVNVPAKILKLLTMTHLDRVFKIYDNIDTALSACKTK